MRVQQARAQQLHPTDTRTVTLCFFPSQTNFLCIILWGYIKLLFLVSWSQRSPMSNYISVKFQNQVDFKKKKKKDLPVSKSSPLSLILWSDLLTCPLNSKIQNLGDRVQHLPPKKGRSLCILLDKCGLCVWKQVIFSLNICVKFCQHENIL